MFQSQELLAVRKVSDWTSIVEIRAETIPAVERALFEAYNQAMASGVRTLVLNFHRLEDLTASGITLLIRLLARARQHAIQFLAVGLKDHHRHIFQLTRLDQAIPVYESEFEALQAAAEANPMARFSLVAHA